MQAFESTQTYFKGKAWDPVINFFRKKSIWLLYYCTGCGAIELPPTMTTRYDMERFGMGPMATPRQADILIITGYISIKTLRRVIRSYEQMQSPKWVMAFGSCPINGGCYHNSYNVINSLAKYIPVDLSIAGCMPRPQAVLDGFLQLMDMIQKGETNGWERYQNNFSFYKANQNRVLEQPGPVLRPDSELLKTEGGTL